MLRWLLVRPLVWLRGEIAKEEGRRWVASPAGRCHRANALRLQALGYEAGHPERSRLTAEADALSPPRRVVTDIRAAGGNLEITTTRV